MLIDLRKPKPQINQREEEGSFTWKEARALEGFLKASNEALEGFIKVEEGALRDRTNWQIFHSTKMGGIIENTPTTPKIFTRVHFFSLFVFFSNFGDGFRISNLCKERDKIGRELRYWFLGLRQCGLTRSNSIY